MGRAARKRGRPDGLCRPAYCSLGQPSFRYCRRRLLLVIIIAIVGTGTVDWDDDGNGVKSLALPGGGFNPPERRIRTKEQDQALPFYNKPDFSCHFTTVRLPSTTKAEQWSHKDDINNRMYGRAYYRAVDIYDGSLRMIRVSRIEQKEVDAAKAQRDNGRVALFDNSMACRQTCRNKPATCDGSGYVCVH